MIVDKKTFNSKQKDTTIVVDGKVLKICNTLSLSLHATLTNFCWKGMLALLDTSGKGMLPSLLTTQKGWNMGKGRIFGNSCGAKLIHLSISGTLIHG